MIKLKSLKDGQWRKNEGGKLQHRPKATFNIFMAKYKEGRAGIKGCENWNIQNTKSNSLVSLSQASSSTAGSSSGKQSRTPPHQNSEGRDCHQQEYHSVPYFPIELPMPELWGPPLMMYPPCPP
jgi:hypothetical protein